MPYESCAGSMLDTGDTAFMVFATTFVMMQTPAMGLAQAGVIRRKNALSMLMQTMFGMTIGSLLWFVVGYSLTFGTSVGGVIGNLDNMFLMGIPTDDCLDGGTIPALVYVAFQLMFALMVPVIVTGAWCEKFTFEAFLIFVTVWPFLVYYPLAHWIWNANGFLYSWGVADFAGGMTIHASSGVAAIIVANNLPLREMISHHSPEAHNIPLAVIGAILIWAGWYSFNAGSALAANYQMGAAVLNTHLSACSGVFSWVLSDYFQADEDNPGHRIKKWKLTSLMNGAFAALASITSGSGFVQPWAAALIGLTGGFISFHTAKYVKNSGIDDVLDVSSLQGVPGCWGALMVGLFASPSVQPDPDNAYVGLFYGGGFDQLGKQAAAVVISCVWSLIMTFLVVKLMKYILKENLHIPTHQEALGLDLHQMGEQAYDERLPLMLDLGSESLVGQLNNACATNDFNAFHFLTSQGVDWDGVDYDGRSALHICAYNGSLKILEYILSHDNRIDFNILDKLGRNPLLEAIRGKRPAVIKFLSQKAFASMDNVKVTAAFLEAASTDDPETLKLWRLAGVDVNLADYDGRVAIAIARTRGLDKNIQILEADVKDLEVAESAFDHTKKEINTESVATATLLCAAAAAADSKRFKRYIREKMDLNAQDYDGRTALHVAICQGKLEIVEQMLATKTLNLNLMDAFGSTPLYYAVRREINLLQDKKMAPSMKAAAAYDAPIAAIRELIKVLHKEGAHFGFEDEKDKASSRYNQFAFEMIDLASKGNIEALRTYAQTGVVFHVMVDYDGRSPLHLAAHHGQVDFLELVFEQLDEYSTPRQKCFWLRDKAFHQTPYSELKTHLATLEERKESQRLSAKKAKIKAFLRKLDASKFPDRPELDADVGSQPTSQQEKEAGDSKAPSKMQPLNIDST